MSVLVHLGHTDPGVKPSVLREDSDPGAHRSALVRKVPLVRRLLDRANVPPDITDPCASTHAPKVTMEKGALKFVTVTTLSHLYVTQLLECVIASLATWVTAVNRFALKVTTVKCAPGLATNVNTAISRLDSVCVNWARRAKRAVALVQTVSSGHSAQKHAIAATVLLACLQLACANVHRG